MATVGIDSNRPEGLLNDLTPERLAALRTAVDQAQSSLAAAQAQPRETLGDRLKGRTGMRSYGISQARATADLGREKAARFFALHALALQQKEQWDAAAEPLRQARLFLATDPWVAAATTRQQRQQTDPVSGLIRPYLEAYLQNQNRYAPARPGMGKPVPFATLIGQARAMIAAPAPTTLQDPDWQDGVQLHKRKSGALAFVAKTSGAHSERDLELRTQGVICGIANKAGARHILVQGSASEYFNHDSGIGKMFGAGLMAALGGDDGDPIEIELKPDWRQNDKPGKDKGRQKRYAAFVRLFAESGIAGTMAIERLGCSGVTIDS